MPMRVQLQLRHFLAGLACGPLGLSMKPPVVVQILVPFFWSLSLSKTVGSSGGRHQLAKATPTAVRRSRNRRRRGPNGRRSRPKNDRKKGTNKTNKQPKVPHGLRRLTLERELASRERQAAIALFFFFSFFFRRRTGRPTVNGPAASSSSSSSAAAAAASASAGSARGRSFVFDSGYPKRQQQRRLLARRRVPTRRRRRRRRRRRASNAGAENRPASVDGRQAAAAVGPRQPAPIIEWLITVVRCCRC